MAKAELVDSDGRSSHELDAVIYEQTLASCLETRTHSAIVRVEPVAVTIEVKSLLGRDEITNSSRALAANMEPLRRYFMPTQFLQAFNGVLPTGEDDKRAFRDGVGALKDYMTIPGIVNAVFAYDGPSAETAFEYLASPHIDIICVLGKYTVARERFGFEAGPNFVIFGSRCDAPARTAS